LVFQYAAGGVIVTRLAAGNAIKRTGASATPTTERAN
jgi:hypothetical protein